MTGFVRACALAELTPGSPYPVVVEGIDVCLARTSDGGVYALEDECSHAAVPLSEGDLDDDTIECWLHGSRFDLRTGRPTGLPATAPVPTFPVRIDGDDVLVAVKE